MKKYIIVGMLILSALTFSETKSGQSNGQGNGQGTGNSTRQGNGSGGGQQRIRLSEEDRDQILKPKNNQSKEFRDKMEKKYNITWELLERRAKMMN